jgi:cytochrome b subunit of formate dehydrogenase
MTDIKHRGDAVLLSRGRHQRRSLDSDIRTRMIVNSCLIIMCLLLTGWHIWQHDWIHAATTAIWAGVSALTWSMGKVEQRTRDESRSRNNYWQ